MRSSAQSWASSSSSVITASPPQCASISCSCSPISRIHFRRTAIASARLLASSPISRETSEEFTTRLHLLKRAVRSAAVSNCRSRAVGSLQKRLCYRDHAALQSQAATCPASTFLEWLNALIVICEADAPCPFEHRWANRLPKFPESFAEFLSWNSSIVGRNESLENHSVCRRHSGSLSGVPVCVIPLLFRSHRNAAAIPGNQFVKLFPRWIDDFHLAGSRIDSDSHFGHLWELIGCCRYILSSRHLVHQAIRDTLTDTISQYDYSRIVIRDLILCIPLQRIVLRDHGKIHVTTRHDLLTDSCLSCTISTTV